MEAEDARRSPEPQSGALPIELCPPKGEQANTGRRWRQLLPNPALPGTLLVPLTRGQFAIIDEADGAFVSGRNWHLHVGCSNYAAGYLKGKIVKMHRFLWRRWGLAESPELDHVNLNGLDNRRSNLRAADKRLNMANRRGWAATKGAYKVGNRWQSSITDGHGGMRYLGLFKTPEEAHAAWATAAREAFGEFARVT